MVTRNHRKRKKERENGRERERKIHTPRALPADASGYLPVLCTRAHSACDSSRAVGSFRRFLSISPCVRARARAETKDNAPQSRAAAFRFARATLTSRFSPSSRRNRIAKRNETRLRRNSSFPENISLCLFISLSLSCSFCLAGNVTCAVIFSPNNAREIFLGESHVRLHYIPVSFVEHDAVLCRSA